MSIDFATAGEFWASGGRPHKAGCRCGDSGRCEYAQAVAEEAAERREMAGAYPCGAFSPHAAHECTECLAAWGYATTSVEPMPPSEQREQESPAVSPGSAGLSDHQDKGTPAVYAEVPVMSPRTGSEAR